MTITYKQLLQLIRVGITELSYEENGVLETDDKEIKVID